MTDDDLTAYCVEGCGRPATTNRLAGMVDDTPVLELICQECAEG